MRSWSVSDRGDHKLGTVSIPNVGTVLTSFFEGTGEIKIQCGADMIFEASGSALGPCPKEVLRSKISREGAVDSLRLDLVDASFGVAQNVFVCDW